MLQTACDEICPDIRHRFSGPESTQKATQTKVIFRNLATSTVWVNWVNDQGEEVAMKKLFPGQHSVFVSDFGSVYARRPLGHSWHSAPQVSSAAHQRPSNV